MPSRTGFHPAGMPYLIVVSCIWAASFGLIKTGLSTLDASFVSLVRLALAFVLFLPFLRPKRVARTIALRLMAIGAVQFGLMYVAYIESFHHLKAHQVALFTIFTPFFVTFINDALSRRFHLRYFLAVTIAVAGSAVLVFREVGLKDLTVGFALVQFSNLCFASGQILYPRLMQSCPGAKDSEVFAFLYGGATIVTAIASSLTTHWSALSVTPTQTGILIYLGVVASGVGFFLWDLGARRTNAGALAICNNLKIPLAIVVSILFFGEVVPLWKVTAGGMLIVLSLVLNQRWQHNGKTAEL